MTPHDAVRSALRELAGEVEVANLARAAVLRGQRRQRRQRQAATAVAAALTAVVMVTGYLTLAGRHAQTTMSVQSSDLAAEPIPPIVALAGDRAPTALLTGWYAQGYASAQKR